VRLFDFSLEEQRPVSQSRRRSVWAMRFQSVWLRSAAVAIARAERPRLWTMGSMRFSLVLGSMVGPRPVAPSIPGLVRPELILRPTTVT
jgi:hypothetical protein